MRKLSLLLALALAACGGSSSKESPKVALFIDTAYVDYEVGSTGSEASNMEAALAAMDGVTVETCTTADIETVLAGKNVFVLPEQEEGAIIDDIDSDGLALMYAFVHDHGGTLVSGGNYYQAGLDLINEAFGYSILISGEDEDSVATTSITAAASGTPFAGGVATLTGENGTYYLDATSLPAGAKVIYADDADNAAVVVIPEGSGRIILLAYDWYNAVPVGSEDGGWAEILETAVNYL